jgi:ribosomal protein L37AE/L43A
VRVLKGLVVSLKSRMPLVEKPLVLSAAQGGERQRSSLSFDTGYSAKAQRTGNPAPRLNLCFRLYIRGAIVLPSITVLQPEAAKPERRLISLNLCLFFPVKRTMRYCPECGGEMHYAIATKHYICKSCGLSVTQQELWELREKLRPKTETDEDERQKHRKEYLKWWLSKKK